MEQELVQDAISDRERFQSLVLDHLARITQQLVSLQTQVSEVKGGQQRLDKCLDALEGRIEGLESRMTKLEDCMTQETCYRLKSIFDTVNDIDKRLISQEEEVISLKRYK